MHLLGNDIPEELVAAFTGGVDGNHMMLQYMYDRLVAAFTGGVDGNHAQGAYHTAVGVAAFTGGVDGNLPWFDAVMFGRGRRLHGRRGLKFGRQYLGQKNEPSPPSRAAWIEILTAAASPTARESPPSRAAWIEIKALSCLKLSGTSPPSRAAWIEIQYYIGIIITEYVAAFTGGVDGNYRERDVYFVGYVAAFTGGVDGNGILPMSLAGTRRSPPSRAAWIEMCIYHGRAVCYGRRRLHGRRGLKFLPEKAVSEGAKSPPSRAAWIEIQLSI